MREGKKKNKNKLCMEENVRKSKRGEGKMNIKKEKKGK